MFYAAIETDTGEFLNVIRPDGRIGGKAVLSFLLGLSGYCSKSGDLELGWFATLEARSSEPICQLLHPLLHSFYSGDWNYKEDEYEFFRRRAPEMSLTEDEFREIMHQIIEKWTDLGLILSNVGELMKLVKEDELEASSWYVPRDTVTDFDALFQTLKMASERKAHRVRIRFT